MGPRLELLLSAESDELDVVDEDREFKLDALDDDERLTLDVELEEYRALEELVDDELDELE